MAALTHCMQGAAARYGVPLKDIPAIIRTEGGRPGLAVGDGNGSTDYGLMQVNSCHLAYLRTLGYTRHRLKDNACDNVYAGTWIFARCLRAVGNNPLKAAACYNAGSHPWLAWQSGYVQRFARNLKIHYSIEDSPVRTPTATPATAVTAQAAWSGLVTMGPTAMHRWPDMNPEDASPAPARDPRDHAAEDRDDVAGIVAAVLGSPRPPATEMARAVQPIVMVRAHNGQ